MRLDKKENEIYVADGYGNHRVAVLDADTGDIKRMWGAYGRPPTDDKLRPYDPDSPQFGNPVHCIALAKDGLVYVCDRKNNRVQVFHKDGSFVRQYRVRRQDARFGLGVGRGVFAARQKAEIFRPDRRHQQCYRNGAPSATAPSSAPSAGLAAKPASSTGSTPPSSNSRGNLYTGEVDTGKRLQKWVPVE